MRGPSVAACALAACVIAAATATAHEYDHPAPAYTPPSEPASSLFNSGGENADWELIATIPTGNPHSDLDYFTSGGETYASVGTLGTGPNSGGQTIVKLTEKGEVKPSYVAGHPSASCLSGSSSVTGLQHDVEATPKGSGPLPAQPNLFLDKRDAQLVIDASDAPGRCHDEGSAFGVQETGAAPQGGLEIIDVTDPAKPKEIALTSHIGQAHTVNVDPKRPHIAFDITQDGITINAEGKRSNETSGNQLDGFEIVDMSSCMNFPAGTPIEAKREKCRPQVYRYRYPVPAVSKSHKFNSMQSCHEVEIYPDDTLSCASITATALFSLKDAFDDNGTPTDFTDDKPKGTPLPCRVRDSSSPAQFKTSAKITDCVIGSVGGKDQPLTVSEWLKIGAPSLEGVKWLGTIPHMGFAERKDIVATEFNAKQDIVAAHESEITESGNFVITSDERGGGTLPGGATCSPGADNEQGNGGLHFFPRKNFTTSPPTNPADAQKLWARNPKGEQAVFRAPIRTEPKGTLCTSHVFQIIPGQNRVFMGYYTQGTQVMDFVENGDGTVDYKNVAYFTPENANTWVSAIFKFEKEPDGRITYYGATGDGIAPGTGRSAIDVFKVTLPAPPVPAGGSKPGAPKPQLVKPQAQQQLQPCARTSAFRSAAVRPRGRGISFSFATSGTPVKVDLFQQSAGRRIVGERRVKAFGSRRSGFRWKGAGKLRDGVYFARLRAKAPDGRTDTRRVALRRVRGRFRPAPDFDVKRTCGLVESVKLERPVFGGSGRKAPLRGSFRLSDTARVEIVVRRGSKVVKRIATRMYAPNRTHRLRLRVKGGRGLYRVTLQAQRPGRSSNVVVSARRL